MPSDELIAFQRQVGHQASSIWTVRPDGTDATMRYGPTEPVTLHDGRLSNDGSRLVAIGRRAKPEVAGDVFGQIFVLDLEHGDLHQVTIDESAKLRPAWSPDGDRIVFERSGQKGFHLFTVKVDGTEPGQLTGSPIDLERFAEPSRTPASSLRGFVRSAAEQREIVGEPEPVEEMPAWSPDGSTIAFVQISPGEEDEVWGQHIWLIGADGSNARALTSGDQSDLNPAWAPDGGGIIFERTPKLNLIHDAIEEPETTLARLELETGRIGEVFSAPAHLDDPCYSPDGREIAFSYFDGARRGIAAIGANGLGFRLITHAPGDEHDYHPTWQRGNHRRDP